MHQTAPYAPEAVQRLTQEVLAALPRAADIDADRTGDVARAAAAQLDAIILELIDRAQAAETQIRGAVMDRLIDQADDPQELYEFWLESREAALLARAQGAIATAQRLVTELRDELLAHPN